MLVALYISIYNSNLYAAYLRNYKYISIVNFIVGIYVYYFEL